MSASRGFEKIEQFSAAAAADEWIHDLRLNDKLSAQLKLTAKSLIGSSSDRQGLSDHGLLIFPSKRNSKLTFSLARRMF